MKECCVCAAVPPRILPCHHSLCEKCIIILEIQRKIICPACCIGCQVNETLHGFEEEEVLNEFMGLREPITSLSQGMSPAAGNRDKTPGVDTAASSDTLPDSDKSTGPAQNLGDRKIYSRAFMLKLQFAPVSNIKHKNLFGRLSDIVVDSNKCMPKLRSLPSKSSRADDLLEGASTQCETINLHRCTNAYKAFKGTRSNKKTIARQCRSILNKMTPSNFQRLVDKMLKLCINDKNQLESLVQLIFDQATNGPVYSIAYANLCVILSKYLVVQNEKGERVSFKALLLNKCQKEFKKDKSGTTAFEAMQKEIDEAESEEQMKQLKEKLEQKQMKAKRRSLGNIRFIGELFKLNMLTEQIMHECVLHLVKVVDEDALECLCRLLATIGKLIDTEKSKNRMDQYFQRIDSIIAKKQTSLRVRFMLQDVVELRTNKWVPRREENNPKTIEQIHKEAQEEKVEKQLNAQRLAQEFRNNPPSRRAADSLLPWERVGQRRNMDGGGWITVPAKTNTIDPGKMKLTKAMSSDDNIQLGPGGRGFGGRVRGGTLGCIASQEGERPQKGLNRRPDWLTPDDGSYSNQSRVMIHESICDHDGASYTTDPASAAITPTPTPAALSLEKLQCKTKAIVDEYLQNHGLKVKFTVVEEAPVSPPPMQSPLPEKIQAGLLELLNSGAENEVVFDWVEANIPSSDVKKFYFIRALSAAVGKSTINRTELNDDLLQKRCILLRRFLDNKVDLELQCLFELQAIVHDMQHPTGILKRLFDVLYDEDVISEDAFNQWESNSDPAESTGKVVALSSVSQFFTWLQQTEEEEEQ